MITFLYDLNQKIRIGDFRNGPYLVDGKPGELPSHIVELEVINIPGPDYDKSTQIAEYIEMADLENKKWIRTYAIRYLTEQEIIDRNEPPPPPTSCTPRQFRLALLQSGYDITLIDQAINAITDSKLKDQMRIEWEYASVIERNHIGIKELVNVLNISDQELNDIFTLAVTL